MVKKNIIKNNLAGMIKRNLNRFDTWIIVSIAFLFALGVILISSFFIVVSQQITVEANPGPLWQDKWHDADGNEFTRRKPITISNSGSELRDYQIFLDDIEYDSDMQSNFNDLRFVKQEDSNYRELDYWLESKTDGISADVWVKVPSIPSGESTIYMYYGNPSVGSASDGTDTFEFFDDFEDNSINSSIWNYNAHMGSISETTKRMKFSCSASCDWWAAGANDAPRAWVVADPSKDYVVDVKMDGYADCPTNTYGSLGIAQDASSYESDIRWIWRGDNSGSERVVYQQSGQPEEFVASTIDPIYLRIIKEGTTYRFYWSSDGINYTLRKEITGVNLNPLHFHIAGKSWGGNAFEFYFDDFRVRKYVSPEPQVTKIAAEERSPSGEVYDLSGYAWSDNIGWISFNCQEGGPGGSDICGTSDYKVSVNFTTGLFSGYAWSDNIGWVSFNSTDLAGCPSAPCEARISTTTGEVSGWARALAHNGWDGWISLRGTLPDYGVSLNSVTNEFHGYAWGSDVVGWISFNCQEGGPGGSDICGTSDYKVSLLAPSVCVFHNVSGYGWSKNIGWISFSCRNCDSDGDGKSDGSSNCPSVGTQIPDYGVDIDESTGLFSGYAWSDNIGWIAFADYDGNGIESDAGDNNASFPCFPNCEARISTTTGEVSGWARALAYGDGWDGWIKLKGIALDASPYGVSLNTASSPSEFEGWAFGGDDTDEEAVIGWISWNHLNCDANNDGFSDGTGACPPAGTSISDYKVTTSVSFVLPNQPPTVTDMNDPDNSQIHCGIAPGITHINFEWKYNDADGDNELKYNLIVNDVNNVNDPNPEINTTINNPSCSDLDPGPAISCNNTSGANVGVDLEYHKTYYWWVRVYDNQGNDSGWVAGPSFNTPDHPWPWPDFTHSPSEPNTKEIVTFTDNSQCWTTGSSVSVPCKNLGVTNYEWDFDYIVAEGFTPNSTVKGDATTSYPSSGSYEVRLRIKDDLGTCTGSGDSPVGVKKPLPEWKEAPPITWIRQFLATIFDLLNF